MLDFVKEAYFFELERKTKLQTALAFPISIVVVRTALTGNALEDWNYTAKIAYLAGVPLGLALLSFLFFVLNIWKFLIGRTYRYIWTADRALTHYRGLEKFSRDFPDAPKAEDTFRDQLTIDLASCAERNATLNDARSANLYHANIAAFIYILSALASASIVTFLNILN